MKQEDLDEILMHYTYNPKDGKVRVNKSSRILTVSEDSGSVSIYLPVSKKVKKINLTKLCWCIFHAKTDLPAGTKLLHKNLNTNNNRMLNLALVPAEDFLAIKNAVDNLVSSLKMQQHPYDQYSYVVKYKEAGILKTEVVEDVVSAKKRFAELQLKYAKLAGKYCNLEI